MQKNINGFTIVELLIVIVVIGILAAITILAYKNISDRAHDTAIQNDLKVLQTKFELYRVDNDEYPDPSWGSFASRFNTKVSKNSYAISPVTESNFIYCYNPNNLSIYVVASLSKSGKKYYIENGRGVTEYTGVWDTSASFCGYFASGFTNKYVGYLSTDTTNGPWRTWVGGN